LIFTRSGEILSDRNDNLPGVKLERLMYHKELSKSLDHVHWQWLFKQGQSNFTTSMLDMSSRVNTDPQISNDVFKCEFIRGFNDLHRMIYPYSSRGKDLGVLVDKCMSMKGQNILFYLMVKQVEQDKFELPSGFKWENATDFEYRQYQKYESLDDTFIIDKLESHYHGSRWVHNAINYYRSLTSNAFADGLWLGYFNFKLDQKGSYQLIVEDKYRYMIPAVKIADKYELKKLRELLASFDSLSNLEGTISEDTPDFKCDTLEKQLFRAHKQLKRKIGKDNLGMLFQLEIIDLNDKAKMVVFVDNDSTSALGNEFNRVLWRDDIAFDCLNVGNFFPDISNQYLRVLRDELQYDGLVFNDCPMSSDEYLRKKSNFQSNRTKNMIRMEESFYLFRWPLRVISMYHMILQSRNNLVKMQDSGKTFSKLVLDQTLGKKKPYSDYRNELFKVQDAQEVELRKQQEHLAKDGIDEGDDGFEKLSCTVYDVDVNIEDIYDLDNLIVGPSNQEILEHLIEEEVKINIIDQLDRLELYEIKNTLDNIIEVVEVTADLVDFTVFQQRKKDSLYAIETEREVYVQSIFSGVKFAKQEKTSVSLMALENTTYDIYYRKSLDLFDSSLNNCLVLLESIEKTQSMIDLVESMYNHENNLKKQEKVIRSIQKINDQKQEMTIAMGPSDNPFQGNLFTRASINMNENKLRAMLEEEEAKRSAKTERLMKKFVKKSLGYQSFSLPFKFQQEQKANITSQSRISQRTPLAQNKY